MFEPLVCKEVVNERETCIAESSWPYLAWVSRSYQDIAAWTRSVLRHDPEEPQEYKKINRESPGKPSISWCCLLGSSSGAELTKWIDTGVESRQLCALIVNSTCQKLFFTSNVLKIFALFISGNISSIAAKEKCWIVSQEVAGSLEQLPMLGTWGVGSLAGAIIPFSCKFSHFLKLRLDCQRYYPGRDIVVTNFELILPFKFAIAMETSANSFWMNSFILEVLGSVSVVTYWTLTRSSY